MSKIYTAQEMREWAEFQNKGGFLTIAEMLRQAADALERDEKREVKYEYAESKNGIITNHHSDDIENYVMYCDGSTLVRRPVGEWEEVNEDVRI